MVSAKRTWVKDVDQQCWRVVGRVRSAYVALSDEAPGWHWGVSRHGIVVASGLERKKALAQAAAEFAIRNLADTKIPTRIARGSSRQTS